MHQSTLDRLACPSCRIPYQSVAHDHDEDRIINGYLQCPSCAIVIPIIQGFAFFTEPRLHSGQATSSALAELGLKLFGTDADFNRYHQQKQTRNTLESYAAFQPFNESTRAFLPLVPHIKPHLDNNDLILDTWGRTGWSGEWLAGLFPENQVISVWEGNSSVLGYRGYRQLLPWQKRAKNLDIIFTDPEKPLPFLNQSIGLLYGLDSLHRYSFYPFASEALRVTKQSGSCVFPHIHLTNNEPDPFFERGCNQFHGRDYRNWLDQLSTNTGRSGWVMSEDSLFESGEIAKLDDDCDTHHYNGLILLLPENGAQVAEENAHNSFSPTNPTRHLVNPFLRFNPVRSTVSVSQRLHNGEAGHLLSRHPVYQKKLPNKPLSLGTQDWLAVIHAMQGTPTEILETQSEALIIATRTLSEAEVLLPVAVTEAALRLQRFHSNQLPTSTVSSGTFWAALSSSQMSAELPELGLVTGEELGQLAGGLACLLQEQGLQPGSTVTLSASADPLMVFVGLVAASLGATTRFIDDHEGREIPGDCAYVLGSNATGETANSLLANLESLPQPWPAMSEFSNGSLEFGSKTGGMASCTVTQLLDTCAALQHQMEVPDWADSEGSPIEQLILFAIQALSNRIA